VPSEAVKASNAHRPRSREGGFEALPPSVSPFTDRFTRRAAMLLAAGFFVVLQQAFVPLEEFVHRSDDAYSYFNIAANFAETGSWTFDGIHPTNGVQPLWAMILSGVAELSSWIGLTDPSALARIFVAITALAHFASTVLLFEILRKRVSLGTAVVAAGAFLFPLGIVWQRTWGMENSLYALLLLSTVAYFEFRFRASPTVGKAALLGVLLGLTGLARLNALLFIPCLLVYFVLRGSPRLKTRLSLATVAAIVAGLVAIPYFAVTYAGTGYLLPISGEVKKITVSRYLELEGLDSRLSADYVVTVLRDHYDRLGWFVVSRMGDALWTFGLRVVEDEARSLVVVVPVILLVLGLVPFLVRSDLRWPGFLRERYLRLAPFSYVLVFGAIDAVVSVFVYPTEIASAIIGWWWAENEIIVIVLVATFVAASISFLAEHWVPQRLHLRLATAALVLVIGASAVQTARFYWDGSVQSRDWHRSFNDEMYDAATWLEANVPQDAIVGSWNSGILGYYATQPVVNLDGILNDYEILPYLERREIAEYIEREGIRYLSEAEPLFCRIAPEVLSELELKEIYSSPLPLFRTKYVIYEVLGPRRAPAGDETVACRGVDNATLPPR